jgi:hypothetical protein
VSEPVNRPTTSQLALRAVSDALDAYATNPALRAAVVIAVPFVGGAFDALAGTAGSNIALDRMGVFIEELTQRVGTLEDEKCDPKVTPEDLVDAAIRAVRGALETGDRDKVRTLASILVGATSTERPEDLDAESVIASLVSLTPEDLRYARRLVQVVIDKGSAYIDWGHAAEPVLDSQFRLMRLQGAGLLETERTGGMMGAGPNFTYRFTPTMWRILELLRAGGETIGAAEGPSS